MTRLCVAKDRLVVLNPTAHTGTRLTWAHVVVRLRPTGPRERFSPARALRANSSPDDPPAVRQRHEKRRSS